MSKFNSGGDGGPDGAAAPTGVRPQQGCSPSGPQPRSAAEARSSDSPLGQQEGLPAGRPKRSPGGGPVGPPRTSLFRRRVTPGMLLLVLLGLVVFRVWVVETVIVDGQSMESTLLENDRVLVLKPLPTKRFEVILLIDPGTGDTAIKRVVGLPGDEVSMSPKTMTWHHEEILHGGQLYVNGIAYDEPYAICELPTTVQAIKLPAGQYYVLGDNRDDSTDSRDYGPVRKSAIRGVAVAVVFPPGRIHAIGNEARPAGPVTAGIIP